MTTAHVRSHHWGRWGHVPSNFWATGNGIVPSKGPSVDARPLCLMLRLSNPVLGFSPNVTTRVALCLPLFCWAPCLLPRFSCLVSSLFIVLNEPSFILSTEPRHAALLSSFLVRRPSYLELGSSVPVLWASYLVPRPIPIMAEPFRGI